MGKTVKVTKKATDKDERPALSMESWESRIVSKAYKLAEKQIDEGTASSQVITTFLKLGGAERKLEIKRMELELKLIEAKTEQIKATKNEAKMFQEAIEAFGIYSGQTPKAFREEEEDGDYDYYDDYDD